MKLDYVVSSGGRSGCHLVAALISRSRFQAAHTHNPYFNPQNKSATLVLLQRRDLFAAIMSMLVGGRTQQWSSYPKKTIPRFRVDCNSENSEFDCQYYWHKNYILTALSTVQYYQAVKLLEFEDVINNFNHVFDQLGITPSWNGSLPEKSPYSYVDIIENIDECRAKFDKLQSTYVFSPIKWKYDPLKIDI
jgi:hypothetical protein